MDFKNFDLETVLEHVIPESSILFKDSGTYLFYLNEEDWELGVDAAFDYQRANESFSQFIKRILKSLMEREGWMDEPLVTIDYMIFCDGMAHLRKK